MPIPLLQFYKRKKSTLKCIVPVLQNNSDDGDSSSSDESVCRWGKQMTYNPDIVVPASDSEDETQEISQISVRNYSALDSATKTVVSVVSPSSRCSTPSTHNASSSPLRAPSAGFSPPQSPSAEKSPQPLNASLLSSPLSAPSSGFSPPWSPSAEKSPQSLNASMLSSPLSAPSSGFSPPQSPSAGKSPQFPRNTSSQSLSAPPAPPGKLTSFATGEANVTNNFCTSTPVSKRCKNILELCSGKDDVDLISPIVCDSSEDELNSSVLESDIPLSNRISITRKPTQIIRRKKTASKQPLQDTTASSSALQLPKPGAPDKNSSQSNNSLHPMRQSSRARKKLTYLNSEKAFVRFDEEKRLPPVQTSISKKKENEENKRRKVEDCDIFGDVGLNWHEDNLSGVPENAPLEPKKILKTVNKQKKQTVVSNSESVDILAKRVPPAVDIVVTNNPLVRQSQRAKEKPTKIYNYNANDSSESDEGNNASCPAQGIEKRQGNGSKNKRQRVAADENLEDLDWLEELEDDPSTLAESAPSKPGKKNKTAKKKKKDQVNDTSNWTAGDIPLTSRPATVPLPLPEPPVVKSPVEYFSMFFSDEILQDIVHQTQVYSVQKGKPANITMAELKTFLALNAIMGVICLPAVVDYWKASTRISQVADYMTSKRFKQIRSTIHFSDNLDTSLDNDRYRKIRPLMQHIRSVCQSLPQGVRQSIDESMIPYKGGCGGSLRQYVKNKPHKWGYKFFLRTDIDSIVYDFIPFSGADTYDGEDLNDEERGMGVGAKTVISLCKRIEKPEDTVVAFDNYFASIPLLTYLKTVMNIEAVATLRQNRLMGCPLLGDKVLEREGRGSVCSFKNAENVIVMKWFDNKAVCVTSTAAGVLPRCQVRRYEKTSKQRIEIPCPKAIQLYNKTMGGVDLLDMQVELYRTPTRAKRYYYPLFGFLFDLSIVNSYLLYRRDCKILEEEKIQYHCNKDFRMAVATSLLHSTPRVVGRPSVKALQERNKIKKSFIPKPVKEMRFDGYVHFPVHIEGREQRCRFCKNGKSRIQCSKCKLVLCLVNQRNCFVNFHDIANRENVVPQIEN